MTVATTPYTKALFDTASAWHEAGGRVLPPKEDGTKAPSTDANRKWKFAQETPAQLEDIYAWYGPRQGVGVVCGAISLNLGLFEFDNLGVYEQFKEVAAATGLGELVERIEAGYLEETPKPGIHWFTRCEEIGGSTKLARRVIEGGEIETLIETKEEGGYAITAPSGGPVHPSGKAYKLIKGGPATIVTIRSDERNALYELARSFDEMPARREYSPSPSQVGSENGRPGDDFNQRADWRDVLHEWTHVFQRGQLAHWRRPGKDRGTSATTGYGGDILKVFSTSTPFDTDATYTKFAAYTVLEHGSDFKAAAKALRAEGYGSNGYAPHVPQPPSTNGFEPDELELMPKLHIVNLHEVAPQRVGWLWDKRFPFGKLSLVVGDPGLGKSYMMLDIAARISLGGGWPDGTGRAKQGNVLVITAEDSIADTIRPRMDALGADVTRVQIIGVTVRKGEKDLALSLGEHMHLIRDAITEHNAVMLIIDPLLAFTGGRNIDANKAHEVRPLLMQIAEVAETTGCVIVGIMHLNKDSRQAKSIYRISSSLAFAAAARSVLGVGPHPDDETLRVLVGMKHNLSAQPQSLSYRFIDGVFAWDLGTVDVDVDKIFDPPDREEGDEIIEADSFISQIMADGPVESDRIFAEAKSLGIAERTLKRAKSKRRGTDGEIESEYVRTSDRRFWIWKYVDSES